MIPYGRWGRGHHVFAARAVVVGQTVARVAVDAVTTRAVVLTRVALALVRLRQNIQQLSFVLVKMTLSMGLKWLIFS